MSTLVLSGEPYALRPVARRYAVRLTPRSISCWAVRCTPRSPHVAILNEPYAIRPVALEFKIRMKTARTLSGRWVQGYWR